MPAVGLSLLLGLTGLIMASLGFPSAVEAEIFITNRGDDSVLVFADDATGDAAPLRRIAGPATGFAGMNGIVVDTENGELFVSVQSDRVLVFDIDADGNVPPLRTIEGPNTGIDFPAGLAVDLANDELFVVNLETNSMLVFDREATGNAFPLRELGGPATGLAQPTGVFVNLEADEVFVTNEETIAAGVSVFPRAGAGNLAPLRQVMGPNTLFRVAVGLLESPVERELSVVDLVQRSVFTFAPDADGDVAPIRVATVDALVAPAGMSLTVDDEFLINDLFGDALVGFPRTASGMVAPTRFLFGPETMIEEPVYVVSTRSPYPGNVLDPVRLVPEPALGLYVALVSALVCAGIRRSYP